MEKLEQLMSLDELIEINEELFHKEFNKSADLTSSAPGRINIIGEHTDYNFGLAMPAAINRWVIISFRPRKDSTVTLRSINFNADFKFQINENPLPRESWQKYCVGAFSIFRQQQHIDHGFDALIWGNVPLNSGVSSSAALEVSFMNGLRTLYSSDMTDLEIVKLCQQVEHQYLKVQSGLLDQYASMFSKSDNVMVLDLDSLRHQHIPVDMNGFEWVLVDSGVTRELAQSGYSQRVNETSEAFHYLKQNLPSISKFRDLKEEHIDLLPNEVWKKRIVHYLSENRRVIDAMDYLQQDDFNSLGKLLNRSHESLRDLYEVSCNELDYLAQLAQNFRHCLGSRMMGGGFGGCTINLVEKEAVEEFSQFIQTGYSDKYNKTPKVENYKLTDGARIQL